MPEFWDGWRSRMATNGLPHQWNMCAGRLANFRRAAEGNKGGFQGRYYDDSDVYKLLEATELAIGRGFADLQAQRDEVWDLISRTQEPDGYINTHFQLEHPDLKLRAIGAMHELYCGGHMIEAACASAERGALEPLDVAQKFADLVISKGHDRPGHQELELALLRLARVTGEKKYKEYAKRTVLARGTRPSPFEEELRDSSIDDLRVNQKLLLDDKGNYSGRYLQDDKPLAEQDEPVGHSVRACYFYAAAAEAFADEPDHRIWPALQQIWRRLVDRRMYLTGGIGSDPRNEGFAADWYLPNRTGYCETCAAIALVLWARRMHAVLSDNECREVADRALFNGVLAGVSHDCTRYFYENPLESWGEHERKAWYECACCPPNIARLILGAGLPEPSFGREPLWVSADRRVLENAGCVALEWGPFVYCCEEWDNDMPPQHAKVSITPRVEELNETTADGISLLSVAAAAFEKRAQVRLKMRPYYSWANSGANAMQVWLQRD